MFPPCSKQTRPETCQFLRHVPGGGCSERTLSQPARTLIWHWGCYIGFLSVQVQDLAEDVPQQC